MTKLTRTSRLVILLLLLIAPVAVHAQRDPPVQQFELKSRLLGRSINYRVLYPVNYYAVDKEQKRFPVLYLLHGLSGESSNWIDKTRIALYATHYDLFVVMIEGGNGWYTDSATVPSDKYESYILQELMPDVEKRFRVSKEREGRALAGLSMGGYGALKFGVKHPEMFSLVASMSGAFGAASWTDTDLKNSEFIRKSLLQTFGPMGSPTRAANDLFKLTRAVSADAVKTLPFVYLDCGTEDFLFENNRAFVALLDERKIPHEYRELPGTHSWEYWDRQIDEILKLSSRRLGPPR
ncbi:MAG: alpha/beta hydrolase family protein [Acidobacteriota bacterium]